MIIPLKESHKNHKYISEMKNNVPVSTKNSRLRELTFVNDATQNQEIVSNMSQFEIIELVRINQDNQTHGFSIEGHPDDPQAAMFLNGTMRIDLEYDGNSREESFQVESLTPVKHLSEQRPIKSYLGQYSEKQSFQHDNDSPEIRKMADMDAITNVSAMSQNKFKMLSSKKLKI